MRYRRMPIEVESPEEMGYGAIQCNLSESSVWDARLGVWSKDLNDLVLCYAAHRGDGELRAAIAAASDGVRADDVIAVPGAAAALFIINSSLLDAGTAMVVARPNYVTNIETPRLIRCVMKFLDLKFENRFEMDMDEVKALVTPETKLISLTYPHNPTGAVMTEKQLRELIEIAERQGCYLLVDETYRDLHREACPPLAASLSERAISVSSLSKAYGLPGIRMGWIITRNRDLQELFLAGKEQIFICNSVVDEEIARRVLEERETLLADIRKRLDENFTIVCDWMKKEKNLEWVQPEGGVVSLPRMKEGAPINTEKFYRILLEKFATYVGPGHWFGMSDRYFRLGYGWEPKDKVAAGVKNVSAALAESLE
jgi:aspartate/methionine/tyrosine aminotransferase